MAYLGKKRLFSNYLEQMQSELLEAVQELKTTMRSFQVMMHLGVNHNLIFR